MATQLPDNLKRNVRVWMGLRRGVRISPEEAEVCASLEKLVLRAYKAGLKNCEWCSKW